MKKLGSLFLLFAALLSSCSTDFDVVGPYREIMVIDGFLDYTDSVQFIRVKKAYLGEGDVLVMAQQKDSTNYANVLDVKIEKVLGFQTTARYTLVPVNDSTKLPGTFYSPDQVLYKCSDRLTYEPNVKYRLVVKNNQTGETATSLVTLVKDLTFSPPIPDPYNWAPTATPALPGLFTFQPGENTFICDLLIRFNYNEYDSATGITTFKTVEMNREDQLFQEEITYRVDKADFWEFLGRTIPVRSGVMRRVDNLPTGYRPLEFAFIAGSEDILTYMQLQGSAGLNIDIPTFTTVQNGLGLVTSRVIHREFRNMHPITVAAFDTSVYTRNLNFRF